MIWSGNRNNQMKTIHAVYQHGVFRPLETVELPERAEVEFEPRPVSGKQETWRELDGLYAILVSATIWSKDIKSSPGLVPTIPVVTANCQNEGIWPANCSDR